MGTVSHSDTWRGKASFDVVEAAQLRLVNAFKNRLPVYFAFSGGKDSLVIADMLLKLLNAGEIDPKLLYVYFIDEEAIFPCIEKVVRNWRDRFMKLGIPFNWYCLEVKHYNCFNALESDESFICWDSTRRDSWIRPMPEFAVQWHPALKPRKDRYQEFCARANKNGIDLVGVRLAESVQRLKAWASGIDKKRGMSKDRRFWPIYDWRDNDVWLYIRNNHVDIPDVYQYLWQTGRTRKDLRISQFFSIDTAVCLVKMNEFYPDLLERVVKREPGAYLAAMYWDSDMFRRSTATRRELEEDTGKDYKQMVLELIQNKDGQFNTPEKRAVLRGYRQSLIQIQLVMLPQDWRTFYEALLAGDPKQRRIRGLVASVSGREAEEARRAKYG